MSIIWWTNHALISTVIQFCESIGVSNVVTVKVFDRYEQAKGTPYEGHEDRLFRFGTTLNTDEIRCIACYKYGGFYFDFDVVFLKDMSSLTIDEFVYRWELQPFANSAIMYLKKRSDIGKAILNRMLQIDSPYPPKVFTDDFCKRVDLKILPCELFDAGWLPDCDPNIDCAKFFNENASFDITTFCINSYAYHWHNKWTSVIHPDSIGGKLLLRFSPK